DADIVEVDDAEVAGEVVLADDAELEEVADVEEGPDADIIEVDDAEVVDEVVLADDAELEEVADVEASVDEDTIAADDYMLAEDVEVIEADEILDESDLVEVEVDGEVSEAELLAERFDQLLNPRDRFYNGYTLIEGGQYVIGSVTPRHDELMQKKVILEDFYIGQYPVTNALFEIFVEETGYRTTAEEAGLGMVYQGRFRKTVNPTTGSVSLTLNRSLSYESVKGACWFQPYGPGSTLHQKRNHPVVQVSFRDAIAFAAWIGRSLPTESQWEAATRTVQGHVYPWGDEWAQGVCNIDESYIADTTPVDQYKDFANQLGLVDTLGNVMEWTLDADQEADDSIYRTRVNIVKGGSLISDCQVRLCSRFKLPTDTASNILGFRCVAR
ncbi:MAG: SUMF1/EgtB/PvdO family nonheme iron enzyme, partial [bacterium]|nr:SUMF1/EgtB/PvdO family nonheme iron enzyme [bacterium]